MNIFYRRTKYIAISIYTMLLLGACSKNNIYIDIIEPDGTTNNGSSSEEENNSPSKENALITFSASIEGRNITRSMSPMGTGLESWLASYLSSRNNFINSAPIAEGDYVTSSPGILTGVGGYKMYLSNNTYNFYAVSSNSTLPAPTFNNGTSEPLSNGVDYLWWHALHQDVTSTLVSVSIAYQHVATQIVIVVSAGQSITLNEIVSATITPTKPGATMDLSSGIITSATSYEKTAEMGINEFTVQYIMLPVKTSAPMTLTLKLIVNGENTPRTYIAPIVTPNNALISGDSYLYRAVINENSISFPNVSVKDWTEVDKTGKPLHPIQN